jgi:hypothetical protein
LSLREKGQTDKQYGRHNTCTTQLTKD